MMMVIVKNQWRTNLANFVPRTYSSHSLAAYHCHADDDEEDECDDYDWWDDYDGGDYTDTDAEADYDADADD